MKLKRKYLPQGWFTWLETILITGVIMLLAFLLRRHDPFFINSNFPWIWFAPVLAALRYGTLAGIVSAIIVLAGLFSYEPEALLAATVYRYYVLGGVLLTVLCGEFQAYWAASLRRYKMFNSYIKKQLLNVNEAYYLIRLSHETLEQNLIAKPITLTGVLSDLQQLLLKNNGKLTANIANRFLFLIEQFCDLKQAGLYVYQQKKFSAEPLAHIGKKFTLNDKDILVENCLQNPGANYFAGNELTTEHSSEYLLTMLLRDDDKNILGILVIADLPFPTLTKDTIQSLVIISNYFANSLTAIMKEKAVLAKYPDCPLAFAIELHKAINLQRELQIPSALVAFALPDSLLQENIMITIKKQQTALTSFWQQQTAKGATLLVLLPLARPGAVEEYITQTQAAIKQRFGETIAKQITVRSMPVSAQNSIANIQSLMTML